MKIVIEELKERGWTFTSESEPFSFEKEIPQYPHGNISRKKYTAPELWKWLRSQVVTDMSEICFNPICRMEFCRHFRDINGMTFQTIGDVIGISKQQANNLYLKNFAPPKKTISKWSKKKDEWVKAFQSGESIYLIANREGCSTETVQRQLKKAGIDTKKNIKRKGGKTDGSV